MTADDDPISKICRELVSSVPEQPWFAIYVRFELFAGAASFEATYRRDAQGAEIGFDIAEPWAIYEQFERFRV
jgi:hypothetical protein